MFILAAIVGAAVIWSLATGKRGHLSTHTELNPAARKPLVDTTVVTPQQSVQGIRSNQERAISPLAAALVPRSPGSSLAEAAKWVERKVHVAKVVQCETSQLRRALSLERIIIDAALKSCESVLNSNIYRESLPPDIRETYDQTKVRLSLLLKGSREPKQEQGLAYVRPDFTLPSKHQEKDIADAIEIKVTELKAERDNYLKSANENIARLKIEVEFAARFREIGGPETEKTLVCKTSKITKVDNQEKSDASAKQATASITMPKTRLTLQTHLTTGQRNAELETFTILLRLEDREIPHLIHFTRAQNLHSILEHGLCPIATLNDRGVPYYANDRLRLDGHRDAVSLSIAHPNDRMFAKYRWEDEDEDWVVLVLDREIAWMENAAFCRHNAADSRISKQPLGNLMTSSAFDGLFSEAEGLPSRASNCLALFDPTDVQAEVLVFNVLKPSKIQGVVFRNARSLARHENCLGQRRVSINPEGQGFFGARAYARKTGWTY